MTDLIKDELVTEDKDGSLRILIDDLPAYRARHGLRIMRAYWPAAVLRDWPAGKRMQPTEDCPTMVLAPIDETGSEPSAPQGPGR